MLNGVKPGIVLTSLIMTLPSRVRKKSALTSPEQSSALKALIDISFSVLYSSSVISAGMIMAVSPSSYLAL
ncbi:Uncharacterised protein [Mycobacteroides abscessus subsp. abscessus]|nr:Uncharacterised protein [Mycobacteroides abscessus subsp. abscessus]